MTMKAAKAAKPTRHATGTRTGMFQGTREMLRSAIAAKPAKSSGLSVGTFWSRDAEKLKQLVRKRVRG